MDEERKGTRETAARCQEAIIRARVSLSARISHYEADESRGPRKSRHGQRACQKNRPARRKRSGSRREEAKAHDAHGEQRTNGEGDAADASKCQGSRVMEQSRAHRQRRASRL